MKEEIIRISKINNIDKIGFCNIKNLKIPYEKYKLQETLNYKCSFQVGDLSDKALINEKYNIYNTIIVILVSYNKVDFSDKSCVSLSSCAYGKDYHLELKDKMHDICEYLKDNGYIYKTYVDNNPLDERLLAYNAGLGFFGKNNLLINEDIGSYFFIGEILTDAIIESDKIQNNKCIGCNKCINVCPTHALNDSGVLNSKRCLSYLTQSKKLDENDYKYFDNCIYGCDKCISICPYNNKIKEVKNEIDIDEFLSMSSEEYKNKYSSNASYWRGKKVLDRNINIYLNNLKKKK